MAGSRRPRIPRSYDSVFARNLHDLIIASGMTYTATAKAIGSYKTTIERMLNHGALPRADLLMRICDYFNVPLEILRKPLAELQAD